MALARFNLEQLSTLDDGVVKALFDRAMRECGEDCCDRAQDPTTRKVAIVINMKPDPDPGSTKCETVMVSVDVEKKIPRSKTKRYQMAIRPTGEIIVNDVSPESIHQRTLDEAEGK